MGMYAEQVVALAQSWIGRKEADGSHREIIDIYNSHTPLARGYRVKYTDAWCAVFVSAAAIVLGYTDIIPTECGCGEMIKLFQGMGRWVEEDGYTPEPGDIIFYDWQDSGTGDNTGWSDHVGVVEGVSGGRITVIEGNYSNSVKRREIAVNGRCIRGYGVPGYDTEQETAAPETEQEPEKAGQAAETEQAAVDGSWGKDTTAKSQKVFGTVQDGIVSGQKTTVKKYLQNASTSSWEFKASGGGSDLIRAVQRALKAGGFYTLSVDGQCGKGTVTAMQEFLNAGGFNAGTVDGYMGVNTVRAWQRYINTRL